MSDMQGQTDKCDGLLNRPLKPWRLFGEMALVLLVSSAAAIGANHFRERPVAWFPKEPVLPKVDRNTTKLPPAAGDHVETPEKEISGLTAQAVLEHLQNGTAKFVDARETHEYEAGHLRGSIPLPSSAVYANIDVVMTQIQPDELVIIYCTGGQCEASHTVEKAMAEFGFTNLEVYTNGWEEITSSGLFGDYIETGAGQ